MRCGSDLRGLGAGGQVLRDDVQIMGDHTQPDPALHAGGPPIAAAVQLVAAFQAADAALDARAPVAPGSKPLLSLIRETLRRLLARFGQYHLRDPVLLGIAFIGGGMQPTVPRQQGGRAAKLLAVMVQARGQLRFFVGITVQDGVAADEPTLDLVQPNTAAKLGRLSRFAFANNRRAKMTRLYRRGPIACAAHVDGWSTSVLFQPPLR